MEVLPASPSVDRRLPLERAADAEKLIGDLRTRVTALLQGIDGASQLSEETQTTLSTCTTELETLVDRIACNGKDEWVLESIPKTWKVSNKFFISSPVGRFLERHRKLDKATLLLAFSTMLLYFSLKMFGTEVKAWYTNEQGETYQIASVRPLPFVYFIYIAFFIATLFVVTHRLNRKLFFCCLFSFEGMALAGSQIGASMIQQYNFVQAFGDSVDGLWHFLNMSNATVHIWMCLLVASIDALMFGRKIRIAVQLFIVASYFFQVVSMRCSSREFPEEFMICQPQLLTFREMGSALMLQATIFLLKNIAGKLEGATFGTLHPIYRPVSERGVDLLSQTVTKRLSKVKTSFRSSVSSSKEVEATPPEATPLESTVDFAKQVIPSPESTAGGSDTSSQEQSDATAPELATTTEGTYEQV